MRRFALLAVIAALSLTPPSANAQDLASWAEQQPNAAEVYASYPTRARSEGVSGEVRLLCTVLQDRALDCIVHEETPPGYGFGAAALRLSERYIVNAHDERVAIGNRVMLPILYKMAD